MNTELRTGFLLINKPVGMSSFGCISRIKRVIGKKIKIGHAGTLDPFASGLLIVAIGRQATRLIDRYVKSNKTYIATGKLGELTDTLDYTGKIIETIAIIPSHQSLIHALDSFGSSYEQTPPFYSALKYQGKPLYLLTRNELMNNDELQDVVQAKKRIIHLYEKEFLAYNPPFFTIRVKVSSGTYIRTLINDIAIRAGSVATTYQLERLAIGDFSLSDAINLDNCNSLANINKNIIPIEKSMK